MAATAEGVFKIIDAASQPIKGIGSAAVDTTAKVEATGHALDELNKPSVIAGAEETSQAVKKIGSAAEESAAKVDAATGSMNRKFDEMAAKGTAKIELLTAKLKEFEHERATATMDVDIAKAEAKIRLVKDQLRSVSTQQARLELQKLADEGDRTAMALLGGGGAGGGGPPGVISGGGFGGGVVGAVKQIVSNVGLMPVVVAAALPAITALAGGLSALIGSFGAGALGAGALGVAGFGALGVGAASVLSVLKPAETGIKQAEAAQKSYNSAVTQFGNASKQAIDAKKKLDAAYAQNPGTQALMQNWQTFQGQFKQATAPARADLFGTADDAIRMMATNLTTFAPVINQVLASIHTNMATLFASFTSPEWQQITRTLGQTFSSAMQPAADAFGNIAISFGHIAEAASPIFLETLREFDHWTSNIANTTGETGRMSNAIHNMVTDLKAWVNLFGAAIKLAGAFFGAGASQGTSMVTNLTNTLDKWTKWVQDNPAKVHDFFDRTVAQTQSLFHALGQIVEALGKIANGLSPILNIVTSIVNTLPVPAIEALVDLAAGGFALKGVPGAFRKAAGLGGGGVAGAAEQGGAAALGARAAARGGGALAGFSGTAGLMETMGAGAVGSRLLGALAAPGAAASAAVGAAAPYVLPAAIGYGVSSYATNKLYNVANPVNPVTGLPQPAHGFGGFLQQNVPGFGSQWSDYTMNAFAQVNKAAPNIQNLQKAGNEKGLLDDAKKTQTAITDVMQDGLTKREAMNTKEYKTLQKLQDQLLQAAKTAGQQTADRAFQDISGAFNIDAQASGPKRAMQKMVGNLTGEMAKLGPAGKNQLLKDTASWADQLSHGSEEQKKIARELNKYVVDQYKNLGLNVAIVNGQILPATQQTWQQIQQAMSSYSEKAAEDATKNLTAVQQQAVAVLHAMGFTQAQAVGLVNAQEKGGAAGTIAKGVVSQKLSPTSGLGAGGPAAGVANVGLGLVANTPNPVKHATGGRIPGTGVFDTVNVAGGQAAPGELIVNRHTEDRLNLALGGNTTVEAEVNKETMPHSAPKPKGPPPNKKIQEGILPGYQLGGILGGAANAGATSGIGSTLISAGSASGAQSGGQYQAMINEANAINARHYPYLWGGGHNASFSGPYDCSGAVSAVLHAGGVLGSPLTSTGFMTYGDPGPGTVTLYANPDHVYMSLGGHFFGTSTANPGGGAGWFAGSPRPGFTVRHLNPTGAGNFAGVGSGAAGIGGGVAPQIQPGQIHGIKSNLPGWGGVLANRVGDLYSAAMTKKLNDALQKQFGGGVGGNASAAGISGNIMQIAQQAAAAAGLQFDANIVSTLLQKESAGGQNLPAHNFGGILNPAGPFQVISSTFAQYDPGGNIMNPADNALAAMRYIKSRYGSLQGMASATGLMGGGYHGYALGGRLPEMDFAGYFANGGTFTATRPTAFVVGDKPGAHERVHIQPNSNVATAQTTGESGVTFKINIEKLEHHEPGDLEASLQRELAALAHSFQHGTDESL